MKIGSKFNQLTYREYISILDRHKKYTDFNPLALYRSIIENDQLDLTQKVAIRDLADQQFFKFFEFLQIKDPYTYIAVSTLGETLTDGDESQMWKNVRKNQEKILKAKRIKHRNFGTASKAVTITNELICVEIMIRQGDEYTSKRSRAWLYDIHQPAKKRVPRDNKADIKDELDYYHQLC